MKILLDFGWLTAFLSSPTFVGVAIILIGLYIVNYYKNQYDSKRRRTARILLSEIRFAEQNIEEIAHRLINYLQGDYPSVLPHNSWNKYGKMFAEDFDQDELDMIKTFYATCEEIEEYIRQERGIVWLNEKAKVKVVQKKFADAVMRSYHHGRVDPAVLSGYKKLVLDTIANDEYVHIPKQTVRILDSHIVRARRISDTSCWVKLKQIARV